MKKGFFLFFCFFSCALGWSTPQYYCTGANSLYFKPLLNLIGSIHAHNYDSLEEISVYDLGMTADELEVLKKIKKVNIYSIKEENPDLLKSFSVPTQSKKYLGWYAWKPVVVKESLERFPYVLWVDSGCTILKPLDELFSYIKREGYFLCTSGDEKSAEDPKKFQHSIGWGATSFVKKKFLLNEPKDSWILDRETIMAGFLGVTQESRSLFAQYWYELTKDLKNFADDGTAANGWGSCRHDQTLLSILSYSKNLKIHVTDFTQVNPINIGNEGNEFPFYITWNSRFVNDKSCIYVQSNLFNFESHLKEIRRK